MLAYAKKKKFIIRIRKQSVELKGKTHPLIGKDWNQIHAPSGSSLCVIISAPSFVCFLSQFLSLFCLPSLYQFLLLIQLITENEGNWELPSLGNTSPAAREGQKVFFGLKSMAALFPSHQIELPGSRETLFCVAPFTGQCLSSMFPKATLPETTALELLVGVPLKQISKQQALRILRHHFGHLCTCSRVRSMSPHRRQISSLSPGNINSAPVDTTQSTNDI